jgi:hypothetical protein
VVSHRLDAEHTKLMADRMSIVSVFRRQSGTLETQSQQVSNMRKNALHAALAKKHAFIADQDAEVNRKLCVCVVCVCVLGGGGGGWVCLCVCVCVCVCVCDLSLVSLSISLNLSQFLSLSLNLSLNLSISLSLCLS